MIDGCSHRVGNTVMEQYAWLYSMKNKALPHYASLGLTTAMVIGSAWLIGKIIWIPASNTPIVEWQPTVSTLSSSPSLERDLSTIQQQHLFGRLTETAATTAPIVHDAPQTQLSLHLVGVVASRDLSRGLAVIASRGKQETYGINESIDGTRVKLKAVYADRVIIENAGRDETLMLDGLDYHKVAFETESEPPISRSASSPGIVSNIVGNNMAASSQEEDERESMASIREQLQQNPRQIFDYVRLSQVKQGDQIIGYRVSPGANRQLFEAVGLRDGDLATQINGDPLSSPETMNRLMSQMATLTELRLTVVRDSQPHDIYIEF